LRDLIKHKRALAEYYKWEGELPEKYFELPPKKKPLPLIPQELSARYRENFPIDMIKTNKSIQEIVKELREEYHFKFIPNDFFVQRPRLPMDVNQIKTKTAYKYPIDDTVEGIKFLEEIKMIYSFSLPIPKHIMTANPTEKPTLPENVEDIKDLHITVPIVTTKQLINTVRLLRTQYYFHRIPDEWIEINNKEVEVETRTMETEDMETDRLEVPNTLEEMQNILDEIETDSYKIQIPITKQEDIKNTLEDLKLIFDLGKIPDYLFKLEPLPEPTWDIIP
jgi:hypothetical protein